MQIFHHHIWVDFAKEKSFRIRPHGDTQLQPARDDGYNPVDMHLFERDFAETAKDPLCLSIGVGDIIDSDRPSARVLRTAAYAGREGELTQDDKKRQDWIDRSVFPYWRPLVQSPNASRGFGLIGDLDGHHHEHYQNNTTSTEYLMQKLRQFTHKNARARYLGEMMCYVIIHVHSTNGKSHQGFNIVMHVQHGQGGSSYIGNDMASLEKKTSNYFVADIFLRGHSTKKWAAVRPILYPSKSETHPQLQEKQIVMVNTGGYLRGYHPGPKAEYVEHAGLNPCTLGSVVIHVNIRADGLRSGNVYPEFRVEF